MKVLDRVVITGKDHPWFGEAGIIEHPAAPGWGADWVVKLNGPLPTCGVREDEIALIQPRRKDSSS